MSDNPLPRKQPEPSTEPASNAQANEAAEPIVEQPPARQATLAECLKQNKKAANVPMPNQVPITINEANRRAKEILNNAGASNATS